MRITRAIAISAVVLGVAAASAGAVVQHHHGSADGSGEYGKSMAGMDMSAGSSRAAALPAAQLAKARLATARYANDLGAAKAAGYAILTKKIAGMGYHYINPKIKGFDVTKPPILVYEKHGSSWQLGALEWVFTSKPATPPLKGATYGSFPAACQYADGTFVPAADSTSCAPTVAGAKFTFWHPKLVTMHVWEWYPNPSGIYASMNPLVSAFG
jgi:hypothetical protein